MSDGSQLLSQLSTSNDRLATQTNRSEAMTSTQEVSALQVRFQSLRDATHAHLQQIENGLESRERLQVLHNELSKWLTDIENQLSSAIARPQDDLSEKKLQLERLRNVQRQLQLRKDAITQLSTLARQLSDVTPAATEARREAEYLAQRYADAVALSHARLGEADESFQRQSLFWSNLQQCQKWILQTSFALMAQNSNEVTSPTQTKEELEKHRLVMEDVLSFAERITTLSSELSALKQATTDEQLSQQLDPQLCSLNDSYDSVLTTAKQIEVSFGAFLNPRCLLCKVYVSICFVGASHRAGRTLETV